MLTGEKGKLCTRASLLEDALVKQFLGKVGVGSHVLHYSRDPPWSLRSVAEEQGNIPSFITRIFLVKSHAYAHMKVLYFIRWHGYKWLLCRQMIANVL